MVIRTLGCICKPSQQETNTYTFQVGSTRFDPVQSSIGIRTRARNTQSSQAASHPPVHHNAATLAPIFLWARSNEDRDPEGWNQKLALRGNIQMMAATAKDDYENCLKEARP